MDVIGPYCEIMRAVLGTKDVPRQGGEGEQLWIGRGAEGDYWERWRTTVVI